MICIKTRVKPCMKRGLNAFAKGYGPMAPLSLSINFLNLYDNINNNYIKIMMTVIMTLCKEYSNNNLTDFIFDMAFMAF